MEALNCTSLTIHKKRRSDMAFFLFPKKALEKNTYRRDWLLCMLGMAHGGFQIPNSDHFSSERGTLRCLPHQFATPSRSSSSSRFKFAINFPASWPISNVLSGDSSATLLKTLFCCRLNFTAGIRRGHGGGNGLGHLHPAPLSRHRLARKLSPLLDGLGSGQGLNGL